MKKSIIASMIVAGTAMAGTTSKQVIPPPPAPEPAGLWEWFAGASIGYLFDYEEEMYHAHLGVDTPWNWGGWRPAFFLEVGYAETDDSVPIIDPSFTAAVITTPFVSEFSMMPVTLNLKLEREIANNLNFYFGAGAGVAFTEFDGFANFARFADPFISADDEVFYAQVFAGLNYDVTDSFEIYGGARWIYLDDSDIAGVPGSGVAGFEDDFLGEVGLRFNF
jgi:opacity protein-like surface antigen